MKTAPPAIPHLLLIDDDEDEIRILSDALAAASIPCQCTWAIGPLHGIKILKYFTPQFIFMDYRMPVMNGIECITSIKQLPEISQVPVILYSSEIDQSLATQAMNAGAFACIRKTHHTEQLASELLQLFSHHMLADQLHNVKL